MSKATDLLPPIRLLASAEEAVGKTVRAVGGFSTYGDDGFLLFTDDTALAIDIEFGYEGDRWLRARDTLDTREMANYLRDTLVLSQEQHDEIIQALQAEWRVKQEQERAERDRAEYARLKAKFEGAR